MIVNMFTTLNVLVYNLELSYIILICYRSSGAIRRQPTATFNNTRRKKENRKMNAIALLSITLMALLCKGETLPGMFLLKTFFFLSALLLTCAFVAQLIVAPN